MSKFYNAPTISNSLNVRQQSRVSSQRQNIFVKKEKVFQLLEEDFPSLSSDVSLIKEKTMNYVGAVTLESPSSQIDKNELSDGWVRVSFENGSSGNIKYEYIGSSLDDASINNQTLRVIDNLILKWENYKVCYNELHGEEAYQKLYGNYLEYYDNFDSTSESDDE
jgi:hypothetical protein